MITTHFFIGTNILYNANEFLYAWDTLQSGYTPAMLYSADGTNWTRFVNQVTSLSTHGTIPT